MFAQHSVKYLQNVHHGKLYYFATMVPRDDEDNKRIQRHIFDRNGWGFTTIEEGCDIKKTLDKFDRKGIVLFDSLTAYVQNNIFNGKDGCDFNIERFSSDLYALENRVTDIVMVSDYIFSDAVIYKDMTNLFMEKLGQAHIIAAKHADVVLECTFSNMKIWKNDTDIDIKSILTNYNRSDNHLKYDDI